VDRCAKPRPSPRHQHSPARRALGSAAMVSSAAAKLPKACQLGRMNASGLSLE
jgi:hypothetical protein